MGDYTIRSIRLPIERVDDETWKHLRAMACEAARYGNRMLAGQYAIKTGVFDDMLDLLGVPNDDRKKLRTRYQSQLRKSKNDEIGCEVRAAMERRCQATWQRAGKLILRGTERMACYSADRALSIRATGHKGGVNFEWDGDTPVLDCKVQPSSTHEPVRLRVALNSTGARKDWYIRSAISAIWEKRWTPGQVTIRFDRMKHKLDVQVSVRVPKEETESGEEHAVLGPLDEHGQLWLRVDSGDNYDFSDRIYRMDHQKKHFQGISRRIRATAGHGPKRRSVKRDLLVKQSFQDWVEGPLHQLSAAIIKACQKSRVDRLTVMGLSDGDLPWHKLIFQIKYKGQDAGIEVSDVEETTPAHVRAKARKVRKNAQTVKRAKEGSKAIREHLQSA